MSTVRFLSILAFYLLLLHNGIRANTVELDGLDADAALEASLAGRHDAATIRVSGTALAFRAATGQPSMSCE